MIEGPERPVTTAWTDEASEPATLPALFLRAAAEFDLADALITKKTGNGRRSLRLRS